jgi:putative two-component system response regulator
MAPPLSALASLAAAPEAPARVLVVDDVPENVEILSVLLADHYRVSGATSGRDALHLALTQPPELILLDASMPGMDGYAVCEALKSAAATADVPVIFLTARGNEEDERRAFDTGAVDFILKPVNPPVLLARVATHVALKRARDFLRDKSAWLEQEIRRRTLEISMTQDATIMALASLAETRDNETGNHLRRTQHYVLALARVLQDHPRYRHALADDAITLMFKSAPLHDIGKVGIPDRILLKPSRLTTEEFEIMKTHTTLGAQAIAHAEALCESPVSFLRYAREIAHYHQEKWDGSGYPEGLAGDDIPVSARLMAVADVYDALISERVYKPALPHATAVEMITAGSGRHFDPDMVDAFLSIADTFFEISQRFFDPPGGREDATTASASTLAS